MQFGLAAPSRSVLRVHGPASFNLKMSGSAVSPSNSTFEPGSDRTARDRKAARGHQKEGNCEWVGIKLIATDGEIAIVSIELKCPRVCFVHFDDEWGSEP